MHERHSLMAIDANALTLADYALQSNSPLVQRIAMSLLQSGMVLQDMPLTTRKSMIANGVRWQGNLPTVAWRKLNDEPVATKGQPTPFQEQAYTMSNTIDVDRKLVEDINAISDPRAVQLVAYLAAVAYDFNDKFINNNHLTGEDDAPVGLRQRLDAPNDWKLASECKIDGGGVVMTSSLSAANANDFLELLQKMLDFMGAGDGTDVVIYVNDTLKRRIARAVRTLGAGAGFNTFEDAFGRTVERFQNAVIRDIGRKADQSTRIITDTETSTGADGASTFTSLYAVKYGEDHFFGWQFESLEESISDLGLLNNGVIMRLVIDWAIGLFQANNRAVARVYNIKVS